jgi:hypothetical protein
VQTFASRLCSSLEESAGSNRFLGLVVELVGTLVVDAVVVVELVVTLEVVAATESVVELVVIETGIID